ncbi:MAG: hydroxyacid dehydrogenase [Tepidisphaeraceae bacterium]
MECPNGLFVLGRDAYEVVYAPTAAAEIAERVNIIAPPQTEVSIAENPELLADIDFIFSGWGCPKMDSVFLNHAPNLKAVFYAAGAISGWATQAVWDRGVLVTTANHANAIPVAEFTVATTLFSLKHGWQLACKRKPHKGFEIRPGVPGVYKSVVGLVGMGTIARLVVNLLASYDVKVLTYDPYLSAEEALRLGVENVSLEQLFAESDVVSLHAPDLPSTKHMINGRLLSTLRQGATFINTARGSVVCESELIQVLTARPDLQAVLDVTQKEPLPIDSPLNTLANVVLTPHIAGSQGRECQRMGQYMVDELDRYLAGRPLQWAVQPAAVANSVHQLQR